MKILEIRKEGYLVEKEMNLKATILLDNPEKLSFYLAHEIEIEEGTTFETIFKLIYKEKSFFNRLFKQELNGTSIGKLMDEMKSENVETITKEEEEISFLEVSKMFELLSFEKGNTIDLYTVLMGVGQEDESKETEGYYIPVSMTALSKLKNYPIKIQKVVSIYKDSFIEDNREPILVAGSSITVYEFLQAILYEVCYYNNNKIKREAYNKQEVDFDFDDKIFELETALKILVKNEEYEKASEIKKELDELKKKQE